MALLFGRKTAGTKWGTINYARGLVITLYLMSWGFSFMATILVQTNNNNIVSCVMSIYTCVALYAGSKVVIYLFLMEKVYVVTAVGSTRRDFFVSIFFTIHLCVSVWCHFNPMFFFFVLAQLMLIMAAAPTGCRI